MSGCVRLFTSQNRRTTKECSVGGNPSITILCKLKFSVNSKKYNQITPRNAKSLTERQFPDGDRASLALLLYTSSIQRNVLRAVPAPHDVFLYLQRFDERFLIRYSQLRLVPKRAILPALRRPPAVTCLPTLPTTSFLQRRKY